MGKTTTVATFKAMCQSAYLETVDPNYALPDFFQNTAFATASDRNKAFFCAPFVVSLDFKQVELSYLFKICGNLKTIKDNYAQAQAELDKKVAELEQRRKFELEKLKQEHKAELNALENTALVEMELSCDEYLELLSALRASHDKSRADLQAEFDKKLNRLENGQGIFSEQSSVDEPKHNEEKTKNQYAQDLASIKSRLIEVINSVKSDLFEYFGIKNLEGSRPTGLLLEKASSDWLIRALIQVNFLSILGKGIFNSLKEHINLMQRLGYSDQAQESQSILNEIVKLLPRCLNNAGGSVFNVNISELLQLMPEQSIVLLIDNYDHLLTAPFCQDKIIGAVKQTMRGFYRGLETGAPHIKFSFVTGVTSFRNFLLFADVVRYTTISNHIDFATIAGFTEDEIKRYLAPAVCRMAVLGGMTPKECLEKITACYGGYCFEVPSYLDVLTHLGVSTFNPKAMVLSPVAVQEFLQKKSCDFPVESMEDRVNLPKSIAACVGSFDQDELASTIQQAEQGRLSLYDTEVLYPHIFRWENARTLLIVFLFQLGYLTIDRLKSVGTEHVFFKIPNLRAKSALLPFLSPEPL